MTRDEALDHFRYFANLIWGEATVAKINLVLSQEEPQGKVLASLAYASAPWAIGQVIIRYPAGHRYTLRVSAKLLKLDKPAIEKILIHEACHLGYPKHDQSFRDLVRKYGGCVSEEGIDAPGVRVQRKEGARYRTVATFDDEPAARTWALREQLLFPGKYRLSM